VLLSRERERERESGDCEGEDQRSSLGILLHALAINFIEL
jgi:hypothetical protein